MKSFHVGLRVLLVGVAVCGARLAAAQQAAALSDADRAYKLAEGVTTKDITFYSEHTACQAKLFLPKGFTASGSAPAVILVSEWGMTAADVEKYAAKFAEKGLVAMAIDYRGWGKSGGFARLAEPIWTDDRLRFHPNTAKVTIKRGRLLPEAQIEDIRNAISFLQGEPGIDPARIGLWGAGESGGHVVTIAARDGRIRAGVLQAPIIPGKDTTPAAADPKGADLQAAIQRARTGKSNDDIKKDLADESRLATSEYFPFRLVSVVPNTVALLFVTAGSDEKVKNADNATAAAEAVRGTKKTENVAGKHYDLYKGQGFEASVKAAADWLAEHLK